MQKGIILHTDDCTYMVVWSGALVLFLALMKSLFLPPPPTFIVAINDYICIRCLFSGCVHNMVNGKRMEHQYRVDKKALYTHLLTARICMWTLCATLSLPLHMTGTYSYWQCCHTPPSSFTVCHDTSHVDVVCHVECAIVLGRHIQLFTLLPQTTFQFHSVSRHTACTYSVTW